MKAINILMTGIGGPGAQGYIHSLKNNGERKVRIIGTDIRDAIDPVTRDSVDGFYVIPRAGSEDYLSVVLDLCKTEKIDVLLPLNTAELDILSANVTHFSLAGTKVCVPDLASLQVINHKTRLLYALRDKGIAVPAFYSVQTLEEFQFAAEALGYPDCPIVVKRPDGNGSRGLRFIDASISPAKLFLEQKPHSTYISYSSVLELLPEVFKQSPLIIMEMLEGQEYSVDSMVQNGVTLRSVCRRVDVIEDSNDVDATVEQTEDVLAYCDSINKSLQLDGMIGYGIKRNYDGKPRILEINPRLQATTVLSVLAGVNFPYAYIKKALGEPFTLPEPTIGIRTVQRKQRLFFSTDGKLVLKI